MKRSISSRRSAAILMFLSLIGYAILLSFYSTPIAARAQHGVMDSPALSPEATFVGTGVGAIPDGGSPCPSLGAPLNIIFNVAGIAAAPSSVSVSVTFGSPNHTFMGDITATLIAPNGASKTLFGRTGATTATSNGDGTDLGGTYVFSDTAPAPPSGGWWQEASFRASAEAMSAGTYRSTDSGGAGAVNPMPPTNLTAAFAGIPTSNGTWILRVTDGCAQDTGSVTAASLTLNGPSSVNVQHIADFDGDGKTDPAVARNTGVGASGQATWFVHRSSNGTDFAQPWGIATDIFVPGDFDGDGKSDLAVWRSGAQAYFYILRSSDNTVRAVQFGITLDDPTVIGDYTGDGTYDIAVYRDGANTGNPSYWYYLASSGPLAGQTVYTQWGTHNDFPAPGDYNGDGKADFCVQRNAGGNVGIFYEHDGTGGADVPGPTIATYFGLADDRVVPGDYDGDGKTDLAVVRMSGTQLNWYYDPSSIAGVQAVGTGWGLSTDLPTQGDYDGDGRTDVAVWRSSPTPGQTSFYYLGTTSGPSAFQYGQSGDYPVANYNWH